MPLTPNRTFRLVVTDEWAIDEYMLQVTFDFRAATVTDAQAAIRTRVANRYELWDSCGDPADLPHYPRRLRHAWTGTHFHPCTPPMRTLRPSAGGAVSMWTRPVCSGTCLRRIQAPSPVRR